MAENTVSDITWKSAAYIEFYPDIILDNDLTKYYLPRFKIRYDKPPKKHFPELPIYYKNSSKL